MLLERSKFCDFVLVYSCVPDAPSRREYNELGNCLFMAVDVKDVDFGTF